MNYPKATICLLSVLLACPLTACGPKQEVPVFTAQYYPDCYDPIDKLCKDQQSNQKLKESFIGGVIGGAGGAIAGFIATGDAKGALIGGAIGAAGGATIGFFHAHLSEIKDRNARLAKYQELLGESSKDWDLERASVESAYKCYRSQIALLTKQVKSKKISKEEFLARMGEIEAGLENINTYWADAQTRIDQKIANGHAYLKELDEEDKAAVKNKKAKRRADLNKASNLTTTKEKSIAMGKKETNKLQQATISDMEALKALADKALVTVA